METSDIGWPRSTWKNRL